MWIESHQELGEHPKTKRAARALGTSVPAIIGHLHLLWWWALDYAQAGDLSQFDAADIADAAKFEGDPDSFVEALIDCGPGDQAGFLERTDGKLLLHDWDEYAGKLIEKREEDRERKRTQRAKKKTGGGSPKRVRGTSAGHPPDGAETAHVPNLTVPNLTVPLSQEEVPEKIGPEPEPEPEVEKGLERVCYAWEKHAFKRSPKHTLLTNTQKQLIRDAIRELGLEFCLKDLALACETDSPASFKFLETRWYRRMESAKSGPSAGKKPEPPPTKDVNRLRRI